MGLRSRGLITSVKALLQLSQQVQLAIEPHIVHERLDVFYAANRVGHI